MVYKLETSDDEHAARNLRGRSSAGAHVLLQSPPDRADSPAEPDLQCAADLAAFFSKASRFCPATSCNQQTAVWLRTKRL